MAKLKPTAALLNKIEERTQLTGLWIANHWLDMTHQQYYKLKQQDSIGLDIIAALMRLPGLSPRIVGLWIEDLF